MSERDVSPGKGSLKFGPGTIILIVAVVVILISAVSTIYQVEQSEEAVILTFGQFSKIAGPGINTKIPFVQKAVIVNTKELRDLNFGFRMKQAGVDSEKSLKDYPEESLMLTGDLNIIDIEWIMQYEIDDIQDWLFKVDNTYTSRESTIRDISRSVINELVGDRTIMDIINLERETINSEAKDIMNEIFDLYELGINIKTVSIQKTYPPEGRVSAAFDDVNTARQDMNRYIEEGEEQYLKEIPEARGKAEGLILEARGYKEKRINEADGDVARFRAVYNEYRKNEEVTKARLYIEMIEEVFSQEEGTDLIDRNLSNFIPIKSLQGQATGVTE